MRIVTLNTWKNEGEYPRRLKLMAAGLAPLNPDIVCLQECFIGVGRDTARTLADELGLAVHARLARVKPRPHDGAMVESSSGLAILSRHETAGGDVLDLPSHPADGERIAQLLDVVVDGRPLRILNLHLTHLRGPEASVLRGLQMDVALSWAARGLSGGLAVAGDLNAFAAAPELAVLKAQAGLDLPTLLGPRSDAMAQARPPIDHLVLQEAGAWRMASISRALDTPDAEGWFPSDHAAVVLDLVAA